MSIRSNIFLPLSVFILTVTISSNAQSPTPTPDQRGLGVQSSSTTSPNQSNQQAREQKPELILQTGYNSVFGATRSVFSPDGRLLATGTYRSNTIKLWDTSNGRELRQLSAGGQSSPGFSPAIAFSRDSRLIAASAGSNTVKIWDVVTGRELQTLDGGAQGTIATAFGVVFIDFTKDGRLVSVSDAIRVWDTANGRELRTVQIETANAAGFLSGTEGYRLNADGTVLLAISTEENPPTIKFIDITTGRETRSVRLTVDDLQSADIVVTPAGNIFAAGIDQQRLRLWEITGSAKEKNLGPTTKEFSLIRFSRDGRFLALSEDYNVRVWDVATGRELFQLAIPNSGNFKDQSNTYINFSEDGQKLASGGFDTPTILWDTASAKQIRRMTGRTNMAYSVRFSADGNRLMSGGRTRWDLRTGRGLRLANQVPEGSFGWPSPDGSLLALMKPNSSALTIVETPSGNTLHTLTPGTSVGPVQKIRFTNDSALMIVTYSSLYDQMPTGSTGVAGSQVKVWDTKTGKEVQTLALNQTPMDATANSDNRLIAIIGPLGELSLWDKESGTKTRDLSSSPMRNLPNPGAIINSSRSGMPQMPNMADIAAMMTEVMGTLSAGTMGRSITSFAFSPDGRTLVTGGVETKSNIDLAAMMTGAMGQKQKGQKQPSDPQDMIRNMKFETTGRIILWDVATGQQLATLLGHGKGVNQIAFSRDGKLLASASTDNTIRIWDMTTKRELKTFAGHSSSIESMDFSPDGRLLASAADDGATFLWDTNTGEHLLTMISLDDGSEWMVVTPQGLFDGTPLSWNQILWRYNADTFNVAPIEWFFNEFYYPGLLSEIFAGKRPRVAQDVSKKDRRQPVVKMSLSGDAPPTTGITQRTIKVKLEVTDAPADSDNKTGSGARDLRLFRNGSLVKAWRGDVLKGQSTVTLEEEITITAGSNKLVAYAFNKDNVKSKDAPLELIGSDSLKRKGTAYIIAVGINKYANEQYNLKYAVADAQSFADEVRVKQNQIGEFERVEIVSLLDENATKANIVAALKKLSGAPAPPTLKATGSESIRRVEPEDTVIIYFAGHGTAQAQRFYLIPHDLGYTGDRTNLSERGLQEILSHSISDLELEAIVEDIDARHLLLVIDACNSGQALEAEEKRRGPMNSKGLAQLAYEKGMYILTAAQSYQAALEVAQLGHGLLTYALVEEGLRTPVADTQPKDGLLIVREWLDFATDRVPLMQEEKIKQTRGVGFGIAFTEGEKDLPEQSRTLQRPRVFYRRELEANPLVIAKP